MKKEITANTAFWDEKNKKWKNINTICEECNIKGKLYKRNKTYYLKLFKDKEYIMVKLKKLIIILLLMKLTISSIIKEVGRC